MALAATCVHEVRTTGSDLNGGAFRTGAAGSDYSQQDSAAKSGNDLTMHATDNTKVNPVAAGVEAADIGNTVFIPPAIPGWTTGLYEITAQDGTYWTLDRSPAAAAEANLGTYKMGGALASPGAFGRNHVAGNEGHIKSGTYTVTSTSSNVAAGCLTAAGASAASNCQRIEGYGSSRGDKGTFPVIIADGVITTFTLVTLVAGAVIENIEVDGNSRTSSRGIAGVTNTSITRCIGRNCTNSAFVTNDTALLCWAMTCSTQPAILTSAAGFLGIGSVASSCTVTGFKNDHGLYTCVGCYSINNSGASADGFLDGSSGARYTGCVAYGNGRDGFRTTALTRLSVCVNCIAETNVGTGYNVTAAFDGVRLFNCGYFGNGTNVSANITASNNVGGILGTASFFTNAAGNDFSLNNNAGGGALLRAAGIPGVTGGTYGLPGISTSSYPDVGGAQHADQAGGSGGADMLFLGSGRAGR